MYWVKQPHYATFCRCRSGFIPIYERGGDGIRKLNNCHDPIIVTSTVGGRCLIPEHCDHLVTVYGGSRFSDWGVRGE
jgi:hypothetical protein